MASTTPPPLADLPLARQLERAEAVSSARFVEARRRAADSRAEWIECGGAVALYDGAESPATQTFCLGLFEAASEETLERLERFFFERGAAAHHEVSPLAGIECFQLLQQRGYSLVELSSVMYRTLEAPPSPPEGVRVSLAQPEEADLWAQIAADGWRDVAPDLYEWIRQIGEATARKEESPCFLAWIEGRPVAAAGLSLLPPVAHLAGASTIPEARRRGAQQALLEARLRYAAEHGCALALMGAAPGSASQRNAERQGFRIAYTRLKWRLPCPATAASGA
ncbi:MAG: GNAT family N-acetyltransferase [Bryobacteraceae bacterium]